MFAFHNESIEDGLVEFLIRILTVSYEKEINSEVDPGRLRNFVILCVLKKVMLNRDIFFEFMSKSENHKVRALLEVIF